MSVFGRLVVHSPAGTYEIPLTGDARCDAMLERLAAKSRYVVTREDPQDPDAVMRAALQEGV